MWDPQSDGLGIKEEDLTKSIAAADMDICTHHAYVKGTFILERSICPQSGLMASRWRVFMRKPLITSPNLDTISPHLTKQLQSPTLAMLKAP